MPRAYRLIWFQHFHKAAGTTVIEHARRAGERFHERNLNGNPLGIDGKTLPLWNFGPQELCKFVESCRNEGVTFIATEWGLPDLDVLRTLAGVVLITLVRDPYERFVSNFIFDYRHGYTSHARIRAYVGSKGAFSNFNYYCRMLCRKHELHDRLAEADLALAARRLGQFDHVALLERPDGIKSLVEALGWTYYPIRLNRTRSTIRRIASLALRGRHALAQRQFRAESQLVDAGFREYFLANNVLDYRLLASVSG